MNLYTDTNGTQRIGDIIVSRSDLVFLFRLGYSFTNNGKGRDLILPPGTLKRDDQ